MALVILINEEGSYLLVQDPKPILEIKENILDRTWSPSVPLPSTRINAAIRGDTLIVTPSDTPVQPLIFAVPSITMREREVLEELAEGLTHKEIAAKYKISPRTVRDRIERLKIKLNANSPNQLVAKAVALGMIKPRLD